MFSPDFINVHKPGDRWFCTICFAPMACECLLFGNPGPFTAPSTCRCVQPSMGWRVGRPVRGLLAMQILAASRSLCASGRGSPGRLSHLRISSDLLLQLHAPAERERVHVLTQALFPEA